MRKTPPAFLLYFLLNFLFLFTIHSQNLLAYAPTPTHANLTDVIIQFYNQNSEQKISSEEKQWIIQGSIEEDAPNRCLNHFYDPVYNKTWAFSGLEYLYPALTAKDWAQNPFVQALYDPFYAATLGPITKSPVFSNTNFTWQKAIYSYIKGNRKNAFLSLGHILHLIEDMTVPAHTREDAHPPLIDSDIYEEMPSKLTFSDYEKILSLLKNQKPLIKNSLNEYFDETANYSNNYFFSSDTILSSQYHLPEVAFLNVPEIGTDGIIRVYLLGYDENKNLFHLAKKGASWRLQSGINDYSLNDDVVLNDYWERLAKKSIINGSGVIKLFFQEIAKAQQDPNFIKRNESNILVAAIQGINNFVNNIFQNQPDYLIIDSLNNNQSTTTLIPNASVTNNLKQTSNIILNSNSTTTTIKPTTTTIKPTTTTIKITTTTTLKSTTTTLKQTTTTTAQQPLKWCSFNTNQLPFHKIIINEIAWMGTTLDSNNEWIELKNISNEVIDLTNWELLDPDGKIKIIFPSNTKIVPNQLILLERTDDNTVPNIKADLIYSGGLNNQNEGLRLFDNNCQLHDEVFASPNWPSGDNLTKRTMERKIDLTWQTSSIINGTPKQENSTGYFLTSNNNSTNNTSVTNMTTTTTTTTTTTNTTTITTTTKPSYPKLLITEIQISGSNSDLTNNPYNEFIELYNPNDFEVNLTNWYLQKKTSNAQDFSSLVPAILLENKIILPHDYFIISHTSSSFSQIADVLIKDYSITDNNTIVLKNPNREVVDKVGYGEANDCEGACALNSGPNKSIQRKYLNENFLDTDNNLNDFEIQNCPSPKSFLVNNCVSLETTTTTTTTTTTKPSLTSTPSIPYITEFSWHPFSQDDSKVVIDFRADSYPFISSTNYTDNAFTAMAFFLHSDLDDASSSFGIPPEYLGGQDDWTLRNIPSIIVSYPNCQGYMTNNNAIIFTNSDFWCHAPGGSRGLSYNLQFLPKDNHYLIEVIDSTNGQGTNFTSDQYLTIGYYGYDNSLRSYLKLIAYDPTKFYFDPLNYYHEPTNVSDFEVRCEDDLCNNLIFSWTSASDQDVKDALTYDLHYVFAERGDDLNNNNLTRQIWEWSQSQNVLGEPIFNSANNHFELRVLTKDLYYINSRRLPGVPLDIFFGIKAVDSEGLKSEKPNIKYLHLPPIIPETTTTL